MTVFAAPSVIPARTPALPAAKIHRKGRGVPDQELGARVRGFEDLDSAALEAVLDRLEEILDTKAEQRSLSEHVRHRREKFLST